MKMSYNKCKKKKTPNKQETSAKSYLRTDFNDH